MPASAVYAAEDQWSAVLDRGGAVDFFGSRIDVPMQRRFADPASVQRYVDGVLALPAIQTAYPTVGPVTVRERQGQARAHYEPAGSRATHGHEPALATIAVPLRTLWAGREAVILHELAHHCACSDGIPRERGDARWHGIDFRDAMLLLVSEVLGDGAALLLRTGYEAAGVRP